MADESKFFEVQITTKDSAGNIGTTHAEFETSEPDAQKAAHLISDAVVKNMGNRKYREIDDQH